MSAKILKVILKGEDWCFTKKYLIYEEVVLDETSDLVRKCMTDARECLKITPDDEEIKTSLVLK